MRTALGVLGAFFGLGVVFLLQRAGIRINPPGAQLESMLARAALPLSAVASSVRPIHCRK